MSVTPEPGSIGLGVGAAVTQCVGEHPISGSRAAAAAPVAGGGSEGGAEGGRADPGSSHKLVARCG